MRSVPKYYKQGDIVGTAGTNPGMEAGSSINTVALLVAVGDEKETQCGGGGVNNWATLFLGTVNIEA
jgi:hypothetical protein